MMDKGRMFKRIRIIFLLSVFLAAGLIRCPLSAFASEPEGDAPDDRITVSADEAGTEASEEAAVSDDIKLAVPDDVYYVTDAAWAVDKNDKDYYVGDGDEYLYKSRLTGSAETERELFSAIHNDILLEEHAGKWYEGHEVIYYPASDKKVYENKASASPLGSAPASFSGSMVFNLKYLPAELSDRFYHYHSKDDDSGWEYTKLQAEKLYAWEYEPYTVNGSTRYRKVKAVEISPDDYEVFTEEGKKYTNSQDLNVETEGYTSRITLSGNVCLKASDFDNASHPIAIVALAYDAAKDADTVSRLAEGGKDILWNSDPIFEMREAGYGSLESNSIYARSYNYYTDDLYTASVLGSFSLNPYNYYFNERDNTLTLYGCSYYSRLISGFSRGYKDDFRDKSGSDLMIDTWEIPAAYTKDGKNYNVVIHNSVDEQFETRNYDHYPIMTTNLIFDAGVAFPDDSTALLNWNSMYGICPSTITIKGNTASIGGNIRKFTGFFSGGTYNKLDIKALDTSGAENMSEMFKGVTLNPGSTSDVPDLTHFNTSNVTDMSGMFREMKIIGTSTEYNVNVSGFNTSKVTDFSHMFDGYHVTNGSLNAGFYPGINTSAWDTSGAEDMSWMFANILFMENTDTGTLDISGLDLTSKLKSMQGMFFGNRRISEYGDDARGLVKIIFPKNMDTTGVTDMSFMFANCDSLSQIDNFTALDTDSVTDMSMMFGTALLDTLFGKVRTVPEPKDAGADTGSWAIDRLGMAGGTYNYYYAVNYYNGYPGDSGPAFTSLDLSNFNTQKVKYAYGMFYNMKQLTGIKWGANTTFDKLTDANHMFLLPGMESLDLTGRRFDSLKYAYGMIDLENAEEIILGADSLDLTHIDSDTNGRFSITAPVVSMDFSNVKLGADSFDADSLYDSYGEGLTEVEELIFPASAPALSASARLRTTFFDDDSNAYDYYAGGNSEALRLTTSGAGYEITDFKAGNNDNGYGLVGNGGTLDIAMDIADTGLSNNLTAYFYVDGNTGYNTARQLTPAPDIKWTVTGDAVTITVDSGSNTNDTVYVTPVKAGTATIALSVNGGEYTAAFKAAVYDGSAKVSLYAPDGSIYKGYALADGTYMVTGYESLHSNETIDLTGNLKLGSSTGSTVAISRIGKDAFSQNGENYSLRDTMKTINIPASVTDIGSSAFDNLTKLESVTIENGSQLKSIGNRAFSGAGSSNGQNIAYDNDSNPTVTFTKNPFSIDLPEGLLTIGDGAFSGADLKTVTIPSTVTSIGTNCFNGGYSDYRLESVVIRTTCLESIPDGLFSEHMKLASIKDADGNPYGFEGCVRIGDNAFYNCNSLTGNFSS
ncbi:MAG: BspA family leucine-rich repeat surface protein, partial [Lachnospiraceae bacterium]|nr:BspA family leucine-rich repeat surface protein [Lachnospiraceae bacterium]